MIYLCTGIYAEGKTDHRFLGALLPRLLEDLAPTECRQPFEIASSFDIGSISPKIEMKDAIQRHWYSCTFFVIHADSGGDREEAHRLHIKRHLESARADYPSLHAVACIPEREIEAWMLVDPSVFSRWIPGWLPALPQDPEKVLDPKLELEKTLAPKKLKIKDAYQFFGEYLSLPALRSLPSFVLFEEELKVVLRSL